MKRLIAEGKFNDGFAAVSTVRYYECDTHNLITEHYRGCLDEYRAERENKRQVGELFMHPFLTMDGSVDGFCCGRYSNMLGDIRKKGIKC